METSVDDLMQFVSFRLGSEVYAIDVLTAREIVECTAITTIPKAAGWIAGVINLRGSVIPVLDLKLKLGMGPTERSIDSRVVLIEVTLDGEAQVIGILADAVLEVFELNPAEIKPPPRLGNRLSTDVLKGVGRRGEHLVLLLDAAKAFSADEVLAVEETVASSTSVDEGWDVSAPTATPGATG